MNEEIKLVNNKVDEVINELFGEKFSENDIDSFEKCFNIIVNDKDFKHKNLANEILKECAKSLNEKSKRLDFPKELKKYL